MSPSNPFFNASYTSEKFKEARAQVEALRTSYVTLECQYARLMDQYMELKGQTAQQVEKLLKVSLAMRHVMEIVEPQSPQWLLADQIQKMLITPSEAKGDTP